MGEYLMSRDVSDKPEEYFIEENKKSTIRKIIKAYKA